MPRFALSYAVLSALLILSVVSCEHCKCRRTMKGREHLHPKIRKLPDPTAQERVEMDKLPKSFDWCKKGICLPSWNQHIPVYCGSCYAHGSLSSAMSRIKILNQERGFTGADVVLGRQSFLNCAPAHNLSAGCDGGEASDVFEFMKRFGLPDESCLPYNATDYKKFAWNNFRCPPEGYCMNCMYTMEHPHVASCFPVTRVVRYKAKSYGHLSGEHAMMKELLRGPITCGIACSDEFSYKYKSGIFEDKTGFMEIDHDVEVIGWGEEDGVKYWHIRNSWGTYWGMNGFFKIRRGINNLGIESDCAYVIPDVTDEDLVWGKHPSYGGSGEGIVPLNKNSPLTKDTADITSVSASEIGVMGSSVNFFSPIVGSVIICLALASIATYGFIKWKNYSRKLEYQYIN